MAYFSATSDDDEVADNDKKQASNEDDDERRSPPPANVPFKKGAVKDLSPLEVRWFYKSHKTSTWVQFRGRDSLLIEVKRRLELNETVTESFAMKTEVMSKCSKPIVVLDGYYELMLSELKIKPIYWAGNSIDIMRGTWFTDTDWSPLDESLATEIEQQHVKMFKGQNIPDTPVYNEKGQKPILHTLTSKNCKVEWNSIIDIQLQPKDRTWFMSLRLKSNFTKIRRGYHTEATYEDGPFPVNHLLLVVHGIGQKRLVNQIISNASSMRILAEKLLKQSYGHVHFRPMFLPVEWRINLKLDEDIIEAITPNSLVSVRSFLNSTAMDIMYYSSPKYRAEVATGLVSVFNKLYTTFLKHNPYFERINGSVSIVAHSLGSVLSYDVITNWSPLLQYEEYVTQRLEYLLNSNLLGSDLKQKLRNLQNSRRDLDEGEGGLINLVNLVDRENANIRFKVTNLFCLGSPLSVFLALRGQKGRAILENFSPVIFNVFNANDPVAYRLEPLVNKLYTKVCPLRIHRFDSKNQTPYQEMPVELISKSSVDKDLKRKRVAGKVTIAESPASVLQDAIALEDAKTESAASSDTEAKTDIPKRSWSAAVLSKFRSSQGPAQKYISSPNEVPIQQVSVQKTHVADPAVQPSSAPAGESSSDVPPSVNERTLAEQSTDADLLASLAEHERLPYRMDYVVKAPTLNLLDTVLSHTNYWQKEDIVMFILSQLYGVSPLHTTKV